MRPRVLVSACLLGVHCRYDGGGAAIPELTELMERCELIPVCPEQLGGLPTPRTPSERLGERILARDGADVTVAFLRGASEACALAERFGARLALLKERSPSCGCGAIYDGSFSGRLAPGDGATAEALRARGVEVFGESCARELIKRLGRENDT